MDDSPKDNEAQDRLKLMIQVRANNGETVASGKMVSGYEGTRGSVMLNGGPVNKKLPQRSTKSTNVFWAGLFVLYGPI
jgi:hypothetical protein